MSELFGHIPQPGRIGPNPEVITKTAPATCSAAATPSSGKAARTKPANRLVLSLARRLNPRANGVEDVRPARRHLLRAPRPLELL
jgi:hypothetical protein